MLTGSDQEVIEAIAESVKIVRQRQDVDWISFYRLVEMLAEIALSSRSYDVRKTAFDEIVASMTPSTPRQVLYKIAITLFSLKSDPLFAKSAEDVLAKQRVLLQSTPELPRGFRWFQNMGQQMEDIDQAILSRYSFQPDPDSKLAKQLNRWAFKAKAFIPRTDILENLVSTFQEYRAYTNQQVICGHGGVGKTTLATSYVKEFGRDYTFVYWIDAHAFEEDFDKLAGKCGIDPNLDRDLKQMELRDYLEREENEGWLLMIDQVDNKDLHNWGNLIPRKGGDVLMTARSLDAIDWMDVQQTNLKCFSPLEAEYYILQSKRLTFSGDNDHVKVLVNRFGYLPLALAQTRAYLERNQGISLKSFLGLYDEERTRIFGSAAAKIGKGENESVHTTWAMNFKQLEEEHPKIAELFSFLSFLGSEEIPYCIIEKWKEKHPKEKKALKSVKFETNQAIQILLDYVLLDVRQEGLYGIHPVIQQVSRDRLDEEQKRKFLQQAVSVLRELSTSVFKSDQTDKIQAFEVLRPHCEAIIEAAKATNFQGADVRSLLDLYGLIIVVGIYYKFIDYDVERAKDCLGFRCSLIEFVKQLRFYKLKDKLSLNDLITDRELDFQQLGELFQVYEGWFNSYLKGSWLWCFGVDSFLKELECYATNWENLDSGYLTNPRAQLLKDLICIIKFSVDVSIKSKYLNERFSVHEKSQEDIQKWIKSLFIKIYNDGHVEDSDVIDVIRYLYHSSKTARFSQKIIIEALSLKTILSIYERYPRFKLSHQGRQVYRDLAEIYARSTETLQKAIEYQEQSLSICRNIYRSEEHPDVKRALALLEKYRNMKICQAKE